MGGILNILGSGVGVPDLDPGKPLRHPPGYLLEKDGVKILLESSPAIEFQLAKIHIDYASISTVAITHFHPDHFGGLVNFVFFSRIKNDILNKLPKTLQIIGPKTLKKRFLEIKNAYWERNTNPFKDVELIFQELSGNGGAIELSGKAKLKGYSTFHENEDTKALSLRIEFIDGYVFTYSGDSGNTASLIKSARSANLFLCEISADVGENMSGYGHLNPFLAGEVAKRAEAKELLLTHYWGNDQEEEIIREVERSGYAGKISLAKDLQKIELE